MQVTSYDERGVGIVITETDGPARPGIPGDEVYHDGTICQLNVMFLGHKQTGNRHSGQQK